MASPGMLAAFKNKKPSKFGDEGPPTDDPKTTGFGQDDGGDAENPTEAGPPHSMDGPDLKGDMGAPGYDEEAKAVDDMADILGVGPEDRQDFGAALKAYVSACIEKTMSPDEGMPPMPGEPDGDEGAADVQGMTNGEQTGV